VRATGGKWDLGALLVASIALQSFSLLSIKISTLGGGPLAVALITFAFILMGARAFTWQLVLKRADISVVYPYTSLVQVLVFLYAVVLFDEVFALHHLLGLGLMIAGISMLGGDRST